MKGVSIAEFRRLREREAEAHVAWKAALKRFEAVDAAFDAVRAAGFQPTKEMFRAYGEAGSDLFNADAAGSNLCQELRQAKDDMPEPDLPSPANINAPIEFGGS